MNNICNICGANYVYKNNYSEAYKILKRDGKVVGSQLLSKDTYKRH